MEDMLVKSERRVSVPPGYLAFGDATSALIAVETGGQEPAMDHLSEEELEEARKRWRALLARLISAIQEGALVPYAWNRKTDQILRLSTEMFSRPFGDLHFAGAELFFLAIPDREKYLEDWVGLFDEKQFEEWIAGQDGCPSATYQTGMVGAPTSKHLLIAEMQRRAEMGEMERTLAGEVRHLLGWLAREHPDAPQPKLVSAQNSLRDEHRWLCIKFPLQP
jgi:hypothetical protein